MTKAKLKAKSHILSLLGDELIGSDALAVFELVKNSYDADATNVDIIFEGIGTDNQKLTIKDNGHGMTSEVIDKVWLTLGTDFKRGVNRKTSVKGRVSLGNKGVGRLAVHKIASNIDLKTKVLESNLVHHLSFNWQKLIDSEEYIQNIEVELNSYESSQKEFPDDQGTEIVLTDFKDKKWNKTKIRDFYRKVSSIKSPFEITENSKDEFNISINLGEQNEWIGDIHKPKEILEKAVYKFNFTIEKSSDEAIDTAKFSWEYVFNEKDINNEKFERRTKNELDDSLDIGTKLSEYYLSLNKKELSLLKKFFDKYSEDERVLINQDIKKLKENEVKVFIEISQEFSSEDLIILRSHHREVDETYLDFLFEYRNIYGFEEKRSLINADLDGIGKIQGEFYVYNLNGNIVSLFFQNEKKAIKQFIKDSYGVRIYRDGVRVFNYGEIGDDWLGLDYQKIQRAGDHFSRKVTIGAINLPLGDTNETLIEKTNREGFIENKYFDILKVIVLEVFRKFEREASSDKDIIQEYVDGFKPVKKVGLAETINDLTDKIDEKGLTQEFKPLVDRISKDYQEMKDIMLNSGMSGLNLSIIFHEVDRELKRVDKELESISFDTQKLEDVKFRVKSLVSILDTFTPILKSKKDDIININDLVERLKKINTARFEYHNIIFSSPLLVGESENFSVKGQRNLIFTAINNLIDNAIYWLGYNNQEQHKGLFITTDLSSFNGPALLIADSGPGFSIEEEIAFQPFVTLKQEGMGLGLYLSNLVLESIGGSLMIVDSSEYEIPSNYNGASLAVVFPSLDNKK